MTDRAGFRAPKTEAGMAVTSRNKVRSGRDRIPH